jgi:hypothetical protein
MRKIRYILGLMVLSAPLLSAQTIDLGQFAFLNNDGPLNVLVEAGIAANYLDSPYSFFVLHMGMDANQHGSIDRDSITLIYKGSEHKMPGLREFRKNYNQERRDMRVYLKMGEEPWISAGMNTYQYNPAFDFFPMRHESSRSTDRGSLSSTIGIRTKVYFKNPGFEPGDKFIIQVKDRKNPAVVTNVVVVL